MNNAWKYSPIHKNARKVVDKQILRAGGVRKINDKTKKSFELILREELLLSEEQLKFQHTVGVHLSEDQAAAFAYACKNNEPVSVKEIRHLLNKTESECRDVTERLIRQVLLVRSSNDTFELAPMMKKRFHDEAHDEAQVKLNATELKIIKSCISPQSAGNLLKILGYKSRTGNYKSALANLLNSELIEMTKPETPRSKSQKYVISSHGLRLLKTRER